MPSTVVDGIEYRFFDHLYAVSRCGKVLRKLAPYKPTKRLDGYISVGGKRLLHRMVASCWLEKPDDARVVHHIDEKKAHNHADNLEWTTQSEHMGEHHHGKSGKYRRTKKTRAKLSAWRTGYKDTPNTAAKKRAILDAVCPKRECEVDGVHYRSIRQAALALGLHVCTARLRFFSKNFPNYRILK